MNFFNGKKSASISENYNLASGSHSASMENVKNRMTAIKQAYETFAK